ADLTEEMRLWVSLLLAAISTATAGATVKSLLFPSETSTSYVDLSPLKSLTLSAFTLCMRVATEVQVGSPVWKVLKVVSLSRLSFYLSGDGVYFSVPELGALETHVCFTWDSQSGATAVYLDGRKSLTKIYKKVHVVRAGGKVLLGQDPDNFLGDFDAQQSFVGEMYDVNLWDSALSPSEIRDLASGRQVQRANVIDWATVQVNPDGPVHE
uniref:Pentraxin family member n=1 Tax=Salarias fasciatus TaxID=181472 RepID=A0A672H404_SALFA